MIATIIFFLVFYISSCLQSVESLQAIPLPARRAIGRTSNTGSGPHGRLSAGTTAAAAADRRQRRPNTALWSLMLDELSITAAPTTLRPPVEDDDDDDDDAAVAATTGGPEQDERPTAAATRGAARGLHSSNYVRMTNELNQNNKQQQTKKHDELPALGTIMRMMPKHVWEIDTATSLFYFVVDFAAVTASMTFLYAVVTSDAYNAAPIALQAAMVAPLQILTGFAMWCMWCIGHDAGHTTVSPNRHVNRIVGEIAHSMICLTPFRPWQRSHQLHHLGHNHLTRDYSHQWFIKEEKDTLHPLIKLSHWSRNIQLPILYLVYLLAGVPDGGHVWFYGRMWENAVLREKLDGAVSVFVSLFTAGTLWHQLGTADFGVVCLVPWAVMSFWLFMVTYLQHHSEDGKLYTDDTFTFVRGAFETVDRNYGKYVNKMSHHMMDGHVVHHLFFARIPHYHLAAATVALQQGLAARGQQHLYKQIDTPNFTQEIIKQFDENWFYVDEKQIVREL
jgi:acyl-lipid omega-3 desaturase